MSYTPRHRVYKKHMPMYKKIIIIAAAVILAVMLSYPFLEPLFLTCDRVSLISADLPQDVNYLKIVYVSDIHAGSPVDAGTKRLIDAINAEKPDLVLLGGDYASDSDSAIEFFRNMPSIHARYAVCAVVGDTDHVGPESNLPLLKGAMYSAGITPIVNEVANIRIGSGSTIYVAGIDDPGAGTPTLPAVASQVKSSDYVIFMSHDPAVIADSLRATDALGVRGWYDLGLFGHTHGGQIGMFPNLLGISRNAGRYVSGWYLENKIDMLVSRGVGTEVLPVRIGCSPQYHVITVRRQ